MKFRDNAIKTPILSAIVYSLLAVVLFSLPNVRFFQDENLRFALHISCRTVATVLAFFAAKACGYTFFCFRKCSFIEIVLIAAGFLVCVNNFPIVGFATGNVVLTENADFIRYAVYCLFIGISEEAVFRGFILRLVGEKFKGKKREAFRTVLISSAIFALCHALNVFDIGVGATLLQIGYTFLTGGLFGAVCIFTGNIVFPAILHIVFDAGGLIFSPYPVVSGNMWDRGTVIITVVLGVAVTAAYLAYLLREKYQK